MISKFKDSDIQILANLSESLASSYVSDEDDP